MIYPTWDIALSITLRCCLFSFQGNRYVSDAISPSHSRTPNAAFALQLMNQLLVFTRITDPILYYSQQMIRQSQIFALPLLDKQRRRTMGMIKYGIVISFERKNWSRDNIH